MAPLISFWTTQPFIELIETAFRVGSNQLVFNQCFDFVSGLKAAFFSLTHKSQIVLCISLFLDHEIE